MMKNLLTLSVAVAFLPLMEATAQKPVEIVEDLSNFTQESLEDKNLDNAEIDQLLEDIDVDGIARFVLGKYSKSLSTQDYNAYEAAFRVYLRGQLSEHLEKFAGVDVNVIDSTQRGAQTIVETRVAKSDGEILNVNWRLRRSDNGWEVIDIEAMNMWLAIEQRAQFLAALDQNGGDINALISDIKAKS